MSNNYIDINGKIYHFDLDMAFEAVKMDYVTYEEGEDVIDETQVSGMTHDSSIDGEVKTTYFDAAYNPVKYEVLRNIMESFFNELNTESGDNALGIEYVLENQGNFYFTAAYNTLLKYGILKIKEYGE